MKSLDVVQNSSGLDGCTDKDVIGYETDEVSQPDELRAKKESYPSMTPQFPDNFAGCYIVYENDTGDGEN